MTPSQWRIAFQTELLKRGGTPEAEREMIDEPPDWLRAILGIPPKFGQKPINCTCAKWYTDGTHAPACRYINPNGDTEHE